VEPIHDPNLRIEFYHNGKPLPHASRFHITFDFGYVALDMTHLVPEDAGEYTVKAINALGQCTSKLSFTVQGMYFKFKNACSGFFLWEFTLHLNDFHIT
jgi:titin